MPKVRSGVLPKMSVSNRKDVRVRHDSTLLIDWKREFDPEAQPLSYTNARMCHADRGNLLEDCDTLEAALKEARIKLQKYHDHYGGTYVGGMEYTQLMKMISAALR